MKKDLWFFNGEDCTGFLKFFVGAKNADDDGALEASPDFRGRAFDPHLINEKLK